jgi:hypothetical protein
VTEARKGKLTAPIRCSQKIAPSTDRAPIFILPSLPIFAALSRFTNKLPILPILKINQTFKFFIFRDLVDMGVHHVPQR